MSLEIRLKCILIDLVKKLVEAVVVFFLDIVLPFALDALLPLRCAVYPVHHIGDHIVREEHLGEPMMAHGLHCSFDIRITKIFDKRNVCVHDKGV